MTDAVHLASVIPRPNCPSPAPLHPCRIHQSLRRGTDAVGTQEPFMYTIAILSFLTGAVLGRSFRVQALVPATAVGLILVAAGALATSMTLGSFAMAAALLALALQFGYVAAICGRCLLTA